VDTRARQAVCVPEGEHRNTRFRDRTPRPFKFVRANGQRSSHALGVEEHPEILVRDTRFLGCDFYDRLVFRQSPSGDLRVVVADLRRQGGHEDRIASSLVGQAVMVHRKARYRLAGECPCGIGKHAELLQDIMGNQGQHGAELESVVPPGHGLLPYRARSPEHRPWPPPPGLGD